MDVSPSTKMHEAIMKMADVFVGEAPMAIDMGPAAIKRRVIREEFIQMQYKMVAMSMRVGVARFCQERNLPTVEGRAQNGHR